MKPYKKHFFYESRLFTSIAAMHFLGLAIIITTAFKRKLNDKR